MNYTFEMFIPQGELDPESDYVDVRVTDDEGKVYSGDFVTLDFLKKMFEKNKRTGECARGSYFTIPNMIVVERLDNGVIKKTIDDLIEKGFFEIHFEKLDPQS